MVISIPETVAILVFICKSTEWRLGKTKNESWLWQERLEFFPNSRKIVKNSKNYVFWKINFLGLAWARKIVGLPTFKTNMLISKWWHFPELKSRNIFWFRNLNDAFFNPVKFALNFHSIDWKFKENWMIIAD